MVRQRYGGAVTAEVALFTEAASLGQEVIWLPTFGEHFTTTDKSRPPGPPRLPDHERPYIPDDGVIPDSEDAMPATISYDPDARRLHVGDGYIDNVAPKVWRYEVSRKQVLPNGFPTEAETAASPLLATADRHRRSAIFSPIIGCPNTRRSC